MAAVQKFTAEKELNSSHCKSLSLFRLKVSAIMSDDEGEIRVYDGKYESKHLGVAGNATSTPPAKPTTPRPDNNTTPTATTTAPEIANDGDDDDQDHFPFDLLLRKACLEHHHLMVTCSQVLAVHPKCTTNIPLRSQVFLWKDSQTTESDKSEPFMRAKVQQYFSTHGNNTESFSASSLLSPTKLAAGAAYIVASPLKWLATPRKKDETTDADDRKPFGNDCILCLELADKCLFLLKRFIHLHAQGHDDVQAIYTGGTSIYSWHTWLKTVALGSGGNASEDTPGQQKEIVQLMQQLPLEELDFLWRVLEHDKILERVHDEKHDNKKTASVHVPTILVLLRTGSTKTDRDIGLARLKLKTAIMKLEAALKIDEEKMPVLLKKASAHKQRKELSLAASCMRLRKLTEKRISDLHNQIHVVQTTLETLESSRHTQGLVQVLASTTTLLRAMRTQPLGDGQTSNMTTEDVLEEWEEEMDRVKEVDDVLAAAANNTGVGALDDDDLMAELAALPDTSDNGGGGTETELAVGQPSAEADGFAADQLKSLKERLAGLAVGESTPSAEPVVAAEEPSPLVA